VSYKISTDVEHGALQTSAVNEGVRKKQRKTLEKEKTEKAKKKLHISEGTLKSIVGNMSGNTVLEGM